MCLYVDTQVIHKLLPDLGHSLHPFFNFEQCSTLSIRCDETMQERSWLDIIMDRYIEWCWLAVLIEKMLVEGVVLLLLAVHRYSYVCLLANIPLQLHQK